MAPLDAASSDLLSSPYNECKVRTASSVYAASINTDILISEVVIAWMLMPFSASALNTVCGDAGMGAHADADDRDLGDVGRPLHRPGSRSWPWRLRARFRARVVVGRRHGEGEVGERCRPREMFWTIMSTLTLASASGPKIAAATPGWSGTRRSVILASSRE